MTAPRSSREDTRSAPGTRRTVPESVGVIGGGRMGAGIAHAFLLAGARVHVVEQDAAAAASAQSRIRDLLRRSRDRGIPVPDDAALSAGSDIAALAGCDLVVEAVPEDPALKAQALTRAEAALGEPAVLASNTSSLSIGELGTVLDRPGAFLGMHFFNPVPSSKLIEVVVGPHTATHVRDRAVGWVEALGKTPIVVRDAPGFASSRLGVALGLEAIRMLEEGVASAADIDTAMRLGYGHPMGPLRTTDVVGLDVRLAIADELRARLGDRFAAPGLLRRMVADGRLGRKTGQGFYEWSEG